MGVQWGSLWNMWDVQLLVGTRGLEEFYPVQVYAGPAEEQGPII